MMHNSLLISDRLRKANEDEIARERRDPHRLIAKLSREGTTGPKELLLEGGWGVRIEADYPGIQEAADDLNDFLRRTGMGCFNGERTDGLFVLRADPNVVSGGFRRLASSDAVILSASDIRGIWAAIVYLEKEMTVRGITAIQDGIVERSPAWKVQIGQAPYGANYLVPDLSEAYLSDDVFRLMIHFGVNGLTIYGDWLLYVKSDRFPELNHPNYDAHIRTLRDAAQRAGKYGISLYYVPVSPKLEENHPLFARMPSARGARISPGLRTNGKHIHNLCSSDPDSLAFHAETMAGLFREVPELGGLILIIGGESYYHCFMRPDRRGLKEDERTNCPRCAGRTPEEVVNGLLQATADAVHSIKPGAPVMAWPYSAFIWSSDPAQLRLLEGMTPGVSLLTTIDKDEWVEKERHFKLIWDYSVDYGGPAGNLIRQAEMTRERNIPLYIKTETAIGLESIHIPYWPALGRLAEKWRNVASFRPAGVLQSWMFFGMWGSRAEELGWWAAWHPERDPDEIVRLIARRDFGVHAERFVQAWERMGEAAEHLPYIPIYFTGPEFIGPAHPLAFGNESDRMEEFEGLLYYLQENEETFSTVVNEVRHNLALKTLPHEHMKRTMKSKDEPQPLYEIVLEEYAAACEAARSAYENVAGIDMSAGVPEATNAAEEQLMIEFVYRTLLTTLHVYRFLAAKERGDTRFMTEIARLEKDNTVAALRLLEDAPWLDLACRNDGLFPSSVRMMQAKLRRLESDLRRLDMQN
jgi:hypothetical protein